MLPPGNSSGSSSSRSVRRVYKSVRDGRSLDPPELRCACKPGRCSIWIWRDILMEYVEEMLDYCGAPLKEMLEDANRKFVDQGRLIYSLRLKIEQDCSDREQQVAEMFIWGSILLISTWLAIGGSASSLVTILLAITLIYLAAG
ncbi:hypothetical protein VPH35_043608 [Triticum aestivum]